MGTAIILSLAFLLFVGTFVVDSQAQPPPNTNGNGVEGNQTLTQILTPDFSTPIPNAAALALFPASIVPVEAPIAVKYTLQIVIAAYNVEAACHPTALSFFGVREILSESFCAPEPKAIVTSYAFYRSILQDFPIEAATYGQFLTSAGLDVLNDTTDVSSPIGVGNTVGNRVAEYATTDGWNSLGDATRKRNRQQFQDSTGYRPVNHADLSPRRLVRPLRWQPLTTPADLHGRFASQVHITPHIGLTGKPLVLSQNDFDRRTVDGPYSRPNKRGTLNRADRRKVQGLIDEVFTVSRRLTPEQIFAAAFWDNKFFSLGAFIGFYDGIFDFDGFTIARLTLGEMMAQHDAILVAWKEKRRHDLVRPVTMIRRLRSGIKTRAFINTVEGFGRIDGSEWEPVIPTQPHSEFPSGSAVLCTASLEHLQLAMEEIVGPNGTIPPFNITLGALPALSLDEPVQVQFETFKEAAQNCGQSRLYAGVHFSPSVPAGESLGTGIGRAAFDHMSELIAGRVPRVCRRCKRV